jgi:hypothetical protein
VASYLAEFFKKVTYKSPRDVRPRARAVFRQPLSVMAGLDPISIKNKRRERTTRLFPSSSGE